MRQKTVIALECLTLLARKGERMMVQAVSKEMRGSKFYTAKTLQELAAHRLCDSQKGPTGGFALANPDRVTIADVMLACGDDPTDLPYIGADAFAAAVQYRRNTTMADLAKSGVGTKTNADGYFIWPGQAEMAEQRTQVDVWAQQTMAMIAAGANPEDAQAIERRNREVMRNLPPLVLNPVEVR